MTPLLNTHIHPPTPAAAAHCTLDTGFLFRQNYKKSRYASEHPLLPLTPPHCCIADTSELFKNFLGSHKQPGNYLEGLSGPENPYLDPRHIAVAQSNQKLDIQGMTRGTRV